MTQTRKNRKNTRNETTNNKTTNNKTTNNKARRGCFHEKTITRVTVC